MTWGGPRWDPGFGMERGTTPVPGWVVHGILCSTTSSFFTSREFHLEQAKSHLRDFSQPFLTPQTRGNTSVSPSKGRSTNRIPYAASHSMSDKSGISLQLHSRVTNADEVDLGGGRRGRGERLKAMAQVGFQGLQQLPRLLFGG